MKVTSRAKGGSAGLAEIDGLFHYRFEQAVFLLYGGVFVVSEDVLDILGETFFLPAAEIVDLVLHYLQLLLGVGELLGYDLISLLKYLDGVVLLLEQGVQFILLLFEGLDIFFGGVD